MSERAALVDQKTEPTHADAISEESVQIHGADLGSGPSPTQFGLALDEVGQLGEQEGGGQPSASERAFGSGATPNPQQQNWIERGTDILYTIATDPRNNWMPGQKLLGGGMALGTQMPLVAKFFRNLLGRKPVLPAKTRSAGSQGDKKRIIYQSFAGSPNSAHPTDYAETFRGLGQWVVSEGRGVVAVTHELKPGTHINKAAEALVKLANSTKVPQLVKHNNLDISVPPGVPVEVVKQRLSDMLYGHRLLEQNGPEIPSTTQLPRIGKDP